MHTSERLGARPAVLLTRPVPVCRALFDEEFDFVREAANLRAACDALGDGFAGGDAPVRVPQPYDAAHPLLPKDLPPGSRVATAGCGLVSKRVLIMERMPGRTLRQLAPRLGFVFGQGVPRGRAE